MVVLGETEDQLARPSITSSSPECEQNSDPPPGDDSDVSSSLEATSPGRRVSFFPFIRVIDIPKIDLWDVHLCFYSQEDIIRFRRSNKWVEEHGFDPDDFYGSDEEETPMKIRLTTDSCTNTRHVSFSESVEILWIPRIKESEWDLRFYNSDDFAEFRHEEWEESGGLFKAFSSCWKDRELDDEEMSSDSTHSVTSSLSSFEDEWDVCFYNSDDFAEFRHEEWEESGGPLCKAFSSCWKDRERDDEDMSDSTHSVSQYSFEDGNLQVVLLEDSFDNGEYQYSR
jgi:hypothetical protein